MSAKERAEPRRSGRGAALPDPAAHLLDALQADALVALGTAVPDSAFCPPDTRTLLLIGPEGGARWWRHVTAAPEWHDGTPDPIDRWSARILSKLAARFGGRALFPSDGPPYPPFLRWAQETGRIWQSPAGMLVHAEAGLWVSFRGALALPFEIALPPLPRPCDSCTDRPCLSACPVNALGGADGYDIAACHGWLDQPGDKSGCMAQGCAARRACPASLGHARLPEQSAWHMRQFHK
ncbi:MAG: ferredoxin [Pararhodobacter sp.]|nr:ferredoxin [Pararhodobacter sp.]